jgi:hypothetical protein
MQRSIAIVQFFCDSSCSLHHPAGLWECNFGDCYDQAAHPPTSIVLQSWGILKPAIRVLLCPKLEGSKDYLN